MAVRTDLNGIKTAIKSILDAANTTTASPIDLSSNLATNRRVRKILTVNPEMIVPQASLFPMVTCYVIEKEPKEDGIAANKLNPKRRSSVTINILGSVWNNNFTAVTQDDADQDICYLMENIELILRSEPTLQSTVTWFRPGKVKYYATALNEQTHLRSGIISLECEVYY